MNSEVFHAPLGRLIYTPLRGQTLFEAVLQRQRQLRQWVCDEHRDCAFLISAEHTPTVSLGRRSQTGDLRMSEALLRARGVTLCASERGGATTYHGPGQIMLYGILHLPTWKLGVKAWVDLLESSLARELAALGVNHLRRGGEKTAGLWVGERKIAAIGIHVSRGVTLQGLCLNVAQDLAPFDWITACGEPGLSPTSLERETGMSLNARDREKLAKRLALRVIAALGGEVSRQLPQGLQTPAAGFDNFTDPLLEAPSSELGFTV